MCVGVSVCVGGRGDKKDNNFLVINVKIMRKFQMM